MTDKQLAAIGRLLKAGEAEVQRDFDPELSEKLERLRKLFVEKQAERAIMSLMIFGGSQAGGQ